VTVCSFPIYGLHAGAKPAAAWLKNFRRISSRWERHAANFLGMVQLGCVLILLRHL
jgi:transposase